MANSFFRFKQFLIEQDRAAMKVTTDACLFGSFFSKLVHTPEESHRVLDIGTGTGLLTLMYAQQFPAAMIDAIEIDKDAYEQALQNVHISAWKKNIHVIHNDLISFQPGVKYDVIICNPPFYQNDLKSPDAQRNKALHSSHLSIDQLISYTADQLNETGIFLLLLPYHRLAYAKTLAKEKGLHCAEEILVKQTENHGYFRTILKFTRQPTTSFLPSSVTIKIDNVYSTEFSALLAPFYLAL